MSLPCFLFWSGWKLEALVAAGQPLPEGTAPWMGGTVLTPSSPEGSPTLRHLRLLAHTRKACCAGTPLLLSIGMSCEKKGPSERFLLLAQEANATQTSDTYSHLTPAAVLFLNGGPASLFPCMQHGSQERGCRTSKLISIQKQINQSIHSQPP